MILQPRGDLKLELFCDADFAGLYKREPDRSLDAARSRTGYIINLSGCPLVWKSQLQTEIAWSTLEAKYSALSPVLRTLLPLLRMLKKVAAVVSIAPETAATGFAEAFDQGCLALATNHRLTSRPSTSMSSGTGSVQSGTGSVQTTRSFLPYQPTSPIRHLETF